MQIGSYFPIIAGAEVFAQKLSEYLVSKGHNVDVVTLRDGDLKKEEEINGVRVYRVRSLQIPNIRLLSGIFTIASKSIELDKNQNYDIIHSHLTYPTGQAGTIVKKLRDKPHIITVQGGDLLDYKEFTGKFGGIIRPLISWSLRNCDIVHSVSNYCSNEAEKLGAKKTIIIPNGVYLEDFKPIDEIDKKKLREKYGYNKKIIISVSRLTPKNGMDVLIRACHRLRNKHDLVLLIIGDGPQREELTILIKDLDMEETVKLMGFIPHEDVPKIMNIADIFVRPSLQEGFGISFIEAMSCRLAIIGTNVGGIPDIIQSEKNGFLVEPDNIDDLAKKIDIFLSEDKLRQEFADAGYQTVKDKFEWNIIFKEMDNLYNNVLNKI